MSKTMRTFLKLAGFKKITSSNENAWVLNQEELRIDVVCVGTQFVTRIEEDTRGGEPRVTFKVLDEAHTVMKLEEYTDLYF